MSLSPPAYLSSIQNNIRARPVGLSALPLLTHTKHEQIPWEGAVRAGNLTDDQLKKIKSVDKVRKEQRKQTIEKDVKSYSTLVVGGSDGGSVLEKALKRSDIIQYILVLATDLINGRAIGPVPGRSLLLTSSRCPGSGDCDTETSRAL